MIQHKVRGVVLRTVDVGEKDKLLTLFTDSFGKITAYANGSRGMKSRLASTTELFCYAEYILVQKGDRYTLREADLIESFFSIRLDIKDIALASYVCEVLTSVIVENQSEVPLLRLLLNTLYAIQSKKYDHLSIRAGFEIRCATELGYMPDLSSCAECQEAFGDMALDVMNGTLLCQKCREEETLSSEEGADSFQARTANILCLLPQGARQALDFCCHTPVERLFAFRLATEQDRYLFSRAAETYLHNHLEQGFKTLDFYKQL